MTRSHSDPGEKRPFCVVPVRALADKKLKDVDRRVLMALGYYANRAGVCWPSVRNLAATAGVEENTVQAVVKRLLEANYVRQLNPNDYDQKKGQWGHSNRYQVLWRGDDAVPTFEEVKDANLMQPHDDRDPETEGSGARGTPEENVHTDTQCRALSRAWSAAVEQLAGALPPTPPATVLASLVADGVQPDDVAATTRRLVLVATAQRRGLPSFLEVAEACRTNPKRPDGVCT